MIKILRNITKGTLDTVQKTTAQKDLKDLKDKLNIFSKYTGIEQCTNSEDVEGFTNEIDGMHCNMRN